MQANSCEPYFDCPTRNASRLMTFVMTLYAAGLQSLLSVSSSYQMTRYMAGSLAVTYQPQAGLGMQVNKYQQFCFLLNVPLTFND